MKKQLPNLLSVFRLVLVWPIVWSLLAGHYHLALILAFLAGITDLLDGMLARRMQSISRFGRIMDPLADKILLLSCLIVLTYIGMVPMWLFILLLARDLYIAAGALLYRCVIGPYKITPNWTGKLHAFVQVTFVLLILIKLSFTFFPADVLLLFKTFLVLTAVLSIFYYTRVWGKRARKFLEEKKS